MNAKQKLTLTLVILAAASATTALGIVQAEAREKVQLSKAIADAAKDKKGVEREYRALDPRAQAGDDEPKSIAVEIGDELGSQGGKLHYAQAEGGLVEKSISSKLDREWKEVNSASKLDQKKSSGKSTKLAKKPGKIRRPTK